LRRGDAVRSIGLFGGFGSIADGFASLGEGMGRLMSIDVDDPDNGSGRWLYKKKPLHPCVLPFYTDASVGDMWQCAECGSQWIVVTGEDDKVRMERIQASPIWRQGQTTGTGGYGYTYTTGPYWYSSETRTEGPKDPENP